MSIGSFNECTGCSACACICPVNAIRMNCDSLLGFPVPKVSLDECIDCGLCEKVCPELSASSQNDINEKSLFPQLYMGFNKNERIRLKSSSGGIFSSLASHVLNDNGVVFGCRFDYNFNVIHSVGESYEDLIKMYGSKYVESNMLDTFRECREYLNNGKKVLYSGTACEIAGLLSYLKLSKTNNVQNLITVDLICSGNTSPKLWKEYILYRKLNKEISNISFRSKEDFGWDQFSLKILYKDSTAYTKIFPHDPYIQLFLKGYSLRQCCFSCRYKSEIHQADFTLGDFWGAQSEFPKCFDDKGLSFVIIQNEKAKSFLEKCDDIKVKQLPLKLVYQHNTAIRESAVKPKKIEDFYADFDKHGFEFILKKYGHIPLWKRNNIVFLRILNVRRRLGSFYHRRKPDNYLYLEKL